METVISNCPACHATADRINYIEIYNNAMTRIVRSADKKTLHFVESSGGDLVTTRYYCDKCLRSFVEQEDGSVKVLEKGEND